MLTNDVLVHKGWTGTYPKGDQVTVSAYAAKDPRPLSDGLLHANARSIKFADGHTVSAGSSADDATINQRQFLRQLASICVQMAGIALVFSTTQ